MTSISRSLVDTACRVLDGDKDLLWAVYKFKRALDAGEYVLNVGQKDVIDARDLLWQREQNQFDQMGSAYLTWQLWIAVVTHPSTISASIFVGDVPRGDKAVEANNKILSRLQYPISASFEGGTQGPDGYVTIDDAGKFPSAIPLEVGSTYPSVLYFRAWRSGSFARWPYESKYIYVFRAPATPSVVGFDGLISSHLKECLECSPK